MCVPGSSPAAQSRRRYSGDLRQLAAAAVEPAHPAWPGTTGTSAGHPAPGQRRARVGHRHRAALIADAERLEQAAPRDAVQREVEERRRRVARVK